MVTCNASLNNQWPWDQFKTQAWTIMVEPMLSSYPVQFGYQYV
jgi:hypothetical protein